MLIGFQKIRHKGIGDYFAKKAAAEYLADSETDDQHSFGSEAVMEALGIKRMMRLDAPTLKRIMDGKGADGKLLLKDQGSAQKHNPGWMFVLSESKELSIAWALSEPGSEFSKAFSEARQEARERVFKQIALLASSKNKRRQGELVELLFNCFEHAEARDAGKGLGPDPHLHIHVFLANLAAFKDGKLTAIETGTIFEAVSSQWLGQMYQSELTRSLRARGVGARLEERAIEGGDKGATYKHAIIETGLTPEQIGAFSQRTKAIHDELREIGKEASQKAKQAAAEATRKDKETWTLPQLRELWRDRATEMGIAIDDDLLRKLNPIAKPSQEQENAKRKSMERAASIALQKLLDDVVKGQRSAFNQQDFRAVFVKAYAGEHDTKTLLTAADNYFEKKIQAGTRYLEDRTQPPEEWAIVAVEAPSGIGKKQVYVPATAILQERIMRAQANNIASDPTPHFDLTAEQITKAISRAEKDENIKFSDNQKAAMVAMATSRLSVIEGVAGAGKSTIVKPVADAYIADGKQVIGLAFQGSAADQLQGATGIASSTINKFLLNEARIAKVDENTVFVIDETGQAGIHSLAPIVKLAQERGAKIIAIGDEKQLAAIHNRGGMGILKEAKGSFVFVEENRRQDKATTAGKEVGEAARAGDAARVARLLDKQGALHRTKTEEQAIEETARDYIENESPDHAKFILAETNEAALAINQEVRRLKEGQGQLGEAFIAKVAAKADSEPVEKVFYVGERIVFLENSKGGQKAPFTTNSGQRATVKNSNQATITGIRHDGDNNPIIKALIGDEKTGKEVEWNVRDYNRFDLGAAVTTYKSQGATKQAAFILVEGSAVASKETSYVALTRHKATATLRGTEANIDRWIEKSAEAADLRTLSQRLSLTEHRESSERTAQAITTLEGAMKEVGQRRAQHAYAGERGAEITSNNEERQRQKAEAVAAFEDEERGIKPLESDTCIMDAKIKRDGDSFIATDQDGRQYRIKAAQKGPLGAAVESRQFGELLEKQAATVSIVTNNNGRVDQVLTEGGSFTQSENKLYVERSLKNGGMSKSSPVTKAADLKAPARQKQAATMSHGLSR